MTEVYLFAETASNSPIKMRSMEAFTNIEDLGKRIIRAFNEQKPGVWRYREQDNLQDFVVTKYTFKIYRFEANSGMTGRMISGKRLWEAMEREDGLKRDIMKSRLRGGGTTQKVLKIV